MSEVDVPQPIRSRPHRLAVRQGFTGTVQDANHYPYQVGTYDCTCGAKYLIFVDQVHYDCGEHFGKYVGQLLDYVYANGGPHPDVIEIPMDAEFST